jgi:hypothetical protein
VVAVRLSTHLASCHNRLWGAGDTGLLLLGGNQKCSCTRKQSAMGCQQIAPAARGVVWACLAAVAAVAAAAAAVAAAARGRRELRTSCRRTSGRSRSSASKATSGGGSPATGMRIGCAASRRALPSALPSAPPRGLSVWTESTAPLPSSYEAVQQLQQGLLRPPSLPRLSYLPGSPCQTRCPSGRCGTKAPSRHATSRA